MDTQLTLADLRLRWNDVLDHLESHDRIAWIAYFDARLADLDGQTLSLDFSDARNSQAAMSTHLRALNYRTL